MKNKILTMALIAVLVVCMATPALAFTQGFNLDDFKLNSGASIAVIDEPEVYGGKALQGDERDDEGAAHFSIVNFSVPADGKYAVWFLAWAENETANSLFLSLDGGEIFTSDYMESNEQPNPDFEYYEVWYWMWMNSRQEIMDDSADSDAPFGFDGFNAYLSGQKKFFDLKAGDHALKVITREPLAKYAGMIITDDLGYDPNSDSALQIGKVDPAAAYPDPAIAAAAAAAAAEAEAAAAAAKAAADAAAAAAAEEAAAAQQPTPPAAAQTGDAMAIFMVLSAAAASGALIFKRKSR
ncbi:MAG: hypothetical protein FWD23_02125 [Oscillospiraceae bacterium]|nr:hypothetical protein [Oscillospiraceae bacterium]